jgi:hypothetical protein
VTRPVCVWLTGTSEGSPTVALRRFKHRATLTVGLLAVCGALLYKGAIWRSHVRLPWLGTDEPASGAETVDQLNDLHESLKQAQLDASRERS